MIKTASDAILNGPSGAVSACILLYVGKAALHGYPAKGAGDRADKDDRRKEWAYEADHGIKYLSPAEGAAVERDLLGYALQADGTRNQDVAGVGCDSRGSNRYCLGRPMHRGRKDKADFAGK